MRIGFDARWYNNSGVGSYVSGLLGALAQGNDEVEVIAYEDEANRVPGLDGSPISRVPVRSAKYGLGGQLELAWRTRQDRLDLFHSPFYLVPFLAPCPVIATIHDVIPFLFPIYSTQKKWLVKMGHKGCAMRAAHVIAVSQRTASDIERTLLVPAEKISVVYNGISHQGFKADASDAEMTQLQHKFGVQKPYIAISAPHNWKTKNLESALEVLRIARSRASRSFQIVAYGPGDGTDLLLKASDLDVIRTGFISTNELAALYRNASLFLLTSLYEGFGLPLGEAMACGCPVVTSSGGSLREIAGNGAQVFDPADVHGMATAVVELLDNPQARDAWRTRGLQRARQFSWMNAAEQTLSVYRKVCQTLHKSKAETCLQP